ncbi:MAG: hypothetical protein GX361_04415 [Bacteroidales bacterium]|nr:hypothetical protein [Bacteroidales bacterium]
MAEREGVSTSNQPAAAGKYSPTTNHGVLDENHCFALQLAPTMKNSTDK